MLIEYLKYYGKLPRVLQILLWPFVFILANTMLPFYRLRASLPHPDVHKGDKFIAIKEFRGNCLTYFAAPYTDGFQCIIQKGTILVAYSDSKGPSMGFSCIPEKPDELEKYVPLNQKQDSRYQGFSIVLSYSDIGRVVNKIV